ncbi:MAG: hypothetical protein HQ582_03870 [Planctomycetes bacterium]|nr:hypothetical protein [Planctomycetota bacterium]
MVTRYEATKYTLSEDAPADLAESYYKGLETQYNAVKYVKDVANGGYNKRIADVETANEEQDFGLHLHYTEIGISGWDFIKQESIKVGFDFDTITGHADGHGISQERLDAVKEAASALPYVEVRRSTGGAGLHLWAHVIPVATKTRAEHAALAKAVLEKMSHDVGYNFSTDIDCMGGILWICAKRALGCGGLELIKPATTCLGAPPGWQRHLGVVKREKRKAPVYGATAEQSDDIDSECADRPRVPLSQKHLDDIAAYEKTGYAIVWNQDHQCYSVHTKGVELMLTARGTLHIYKTLSEGTEPYEPNAFMYSTKDGWRVVRFGKGTTEAESWETSQNGWTYCTVGETPSIAKVAKHLGITRYPVESRVTYAGSAEQAVKMAAVYGIQLGLPDYTASRQVRITPGKHGLKVEFDRQSSDTSPGASWCAVKSNWCRVYDVDVDPKTTDYSWRIDHRVRQVVEGGKSQGLYARAPRSWNRLDRPQVKALMGHADIGNVEDVLGWCAQNPWEEVTIPLADEYPGGRRWNRNGATLRFSLTTCDGPTPHWDRIWKHCGAGIDDAVESDDWCKSKGIKNGADYLLHWSANMIREPERRLPLLAMYCLQQETGKSIFHEALSLLMDGGYVDGLKALTNRSDFNGELAGKVLVALDEMSRKALHDHYIRIKQWVTNKTINIMHKGKDAVTMTNYTHWVITTQFRTGIPLEPGDTRVVLWEVPRFEGEEIRKPVLMEALEKEAPFFLRKLFALDISGSAGRHTLPVLMTDEKRMTLDERREASAQPELEGKAAKLYDAIVKATPLEGTPAELDKTLGDWGVEGSARSRATTIGRYMPMLMPVLERKGLKVASERVPSTKSLRYTITTGGTDHAIVS